MDREILNMADRSEFRPDREWYQFMNIPPVLQEAEFR